MLNVILFGAPGVGKSTVGRVLADRLSAKFVDTDQLIIQRAGMSIAEIFEQHGERGFRDLEKETILGLGETTHAVIATGGGAVLDSENLKFLLALGKTFTLHARAKTIYKRLQGQNKRPILPTEDLQVSTIQDLLDVRLPFYRKAQYHVNTDHLSPEQVAESVMEMLKS